MALSINSYAQISISIKGEMFKDAITKVEKCLGVSFFYSNSLPALSSIVNLECKDSSLEQILNELTSDLSIEWGFAGEGQIILREKKFQESPAKEKHKVRGRVVDGNGAPVIGAGIMISEENGAISDMDGYFTLELDNAYAQLKVVSLGFETTLIKLNGRSNIEIVLKEDTQVLEESVVVGYGTQKKVNLTGSVSMIGAEEMTSRPISNIASGIQGLLPGVSVISPSGQPGNSRATIRVRGIGTIGNADPLILIDGVEGDISTLNPDDVESMSVLKDAASSSIYGARAANGVILVTTKKLSTNNKQVEPSITFSSYSGIQTPTRLPEMCNAEEFMLLDNEARANVGTPAAWSDQDFEKVKNGSSPNYYADTDWLGAVLKEVALQQNYSIGINGNIGNAGYMMSYRYLNQQGLTVGNTTGEKRHNFRIKLNTKMLSRVNLSTNIGYMNSNVLSPVNSLSNGDGAIYNAMRIAPNAPIYYTDGTWAYGGGNTNPVAVLCDGGSINTGSEQVSIHNVVKFDILKGWDATATYNITSNNAFRNTLKKTITFVNPDDKSTFNYSSPNTLKNRDIRGIQQTLIFQTNFDFNFNNHSISGVAGFSQEWSESAWFEAGRNKLITEKDPTLNLGDPSTMSNDSGARSWAIRSGFGRVAYNYEGRYLVEVNLRYDLSSRFHKSNRGGVFPSFSTGWRVSEESFMRPTRNVLDNLKIRVSWGMLGNQYVSSSDYPYLSVLREYTSGISLIGTNATTAYVQSSLANPKLSWEKIKMFDVGLDISLFKNRLNLTFDWYDKNTEGILLRLNYPAQIGALPSEQNAGKVNNRGWEFDLGWKDQLGDIFYSLSFNLSDVKNKIVDLAGNYPDLSGYQIRAVGHPIDAFYGYIAEGLMTADDFKVSDKVNHIYNLPKIPVVLGNAYQPGDIKYRDIDGPEGTPDGRITPEYDKTVIGSNIPRYTYCGRMDLGWRGIDFSLVLQGVGKCDGYLTGTARHALQDMAAYPQKVHLNRFNVSTNPDPNASYPRLTYNTGYNQNTFSTFWLEDASYLRVKNMQLGYSFAGEWMSKARMRKCRIYFSAENLLTLSKFFYAYDPETPVSTGGYYPQVKTFVLGLDIMFK